MNSLEFKQLPLEILSKLSNESRIGLTRLVEYFERNPSADFDHSTMPSFKLASVLVLLYEEEGVLRVLLTKRALTLRSYPGKTALPGGKADETDKDVVETAYREAFEEVGLPLDSPHVHTIGILGPHVFYKMLVTPVVAFLSRPAVLKSLIRSEAEVDCIYTHPLEALLDPCLSSSESLAPMGSTDWPHETTYHNKTDYIVPSLRGTTYRYHHFRTSASAIDGLTADILIQIAQICYEKATVYERYAPNQLNDAQVVDIWRQNELKLVPGRNQFSTPVGIFCV